MSKFYAQGSGSESSGSSSEDDDNEAPVPSKPIPAGKQTVYVSSFYFNFVNIKSQDYIQVTIAAPMQYGFLLLNCHKEYGAKLTTISFWFPFARNLFSCDNQSENIRSSILFTQ